ncbi:MFS transporter [Granulicella arctica]|uniref:ACS family hexuronate transporter-like MFS transporter n=1 Tax=Granulicella arctica TaxID=940613 RepID=A0A7Y9PH53_9BACT|nr:MFS transporter [Granulicella arctica]NYF79805.1 ACS family hexuronate transporter-like MFS transporter [Granulicella arctica]
MSTQSALPDSGFTSRESQSPNIRWFVCFLLFLATTINYMDRSVLSLIEPLLHLSFMGWIPGIGAAHQSAYNINYGHIIICFQVAYGVGLLFAGRVIDKLGTKRGYALAILVWGIASISHSLVTSVIGFCIARAVLGLGEAGNFPAAIKATTEWFPSEERALATGLFNSGSNASFFIAPILIAAVTARFGWHAAFICTGSMGLIWAVVWLIFPYNRLRRGSTQSQVNLETDLAAAARNQGLSSALFRHRGLYAFAIAKGLTDPIWWFYLFYLPKFLNENYGMDLNHAKYPLIVIYSVSSVGSIGGGWLSGFRMKHGHSVNSGRKFALLICALCVLPIMLVPHMGALFPTNAWPAIALFSLAAAAHQGWSANLFSTPTDMFPSTTVSTVVGIGGAVGAAGGAIFTWIVSHYFSLHPLLIFLLAGFAYLTALAIFQKLVPRLGEVRSV